MKDNRPVNLDITTIQLPLAAIASITHRVSGIIVFVGIAILLWAFEQSLTSQQSFESLKATLTSPLFKFVLWGIFSALAYHVVAGVKHLLLDMGIGETKEAGPIGAKIVIAVSAVVIVLLGVWIW